MRFQILICFAILTFTFILSGCPSGGPSGNTVLTTNQTTVSDPNKSNSALNTSKTPTEATTNDAPTVAPVFKAYCDAMTKKDEAALRKVYSQTTLKYYEQEMKADNVKTLLEYMEAEQVSNKLCEVRNEKIEGDAATAEVKTEGMPNGVKIKFVKENGEWKITNEFPDFDAVKKGAENTNTAK